MIETYQSTQYITAFCIWGLAGKEFKDVDLGSKIPIQSDGQSNLIDGGPALLLTALKGSEANFLMPGTTAHIERACEVMHQDFRVVLMAQGELAQYWA